MATKEYTFDVAEMPRPRGDETLVVFEIAADDRMPARYAYRVQPNEQPAAIPPKGGNVMESYKRKMESTDLSKGLRLKNVIAMMNQSDYDKATGDVPKNKGGRPPKAEADEE